jgi:succinate dehydrogenase / fumarate reductase, cytochrome b subunit
MYQSIKEQPNCQANRQSKKGIIMGTEAKRPISPHLGVYKRGPHIMISIIHRLTGFVLATVAMLVLVWWLGAIAGGEASYAHFWKLAVDAGKSPSGWEVFCNWFFRIAAIGVLWSFFQHLFSGLRHLVMDMGAGYELETNRRWTLMVFAGSILATAAIVLYAIYHNMGN